MDHTICPNQSAKGSRVNSRNLSLIWTIIKCIKFLNLGPGYTIVPANFYSKIGTGSITSLRRSIIVHKGLKHLHVHCISCVHTITLSGPAMWSCSFSIQLILPYLDVWSRGDYLDQHGGTCQVGGKKGACAPPLSWTTKQTLIIDTESVVIICRVEP